MAVSQTRQNIHVQAKQNQDISQYFSSSCRCPATSCRAGPHSEHAALFWGDKQHSHKPLIHFFSSSFYNQSMAIIWYGILPCSVSDHCTVYICSQVLAVPSIPMHGESLRTVQALVSSQARLSYQHCFSHQCNAEH